MSIIKLFESFDTGDKTKEEKDIYMSRKDAFKKLSSFTKKAALSSLPLAAFTAMPKMAFAGQKAAVDVLKFALLLERLEYFYYLQGVDSGVIPAADMAVFEEIRNNEKAHVDLLEDVIANTFNEDPGTGSADMFNYQALGANPFENYELFLKLSQAFEDTGVRAYKGQAPNLIENDDLLTVALQIHSVEARHAAQVRRMRGRKGWITEPDYDGIEGAEQATAPIYQNEQNKTHLGVLVTDVTEVDALAVEEGWDEPLSQEQVTNIVSPFLAQ
jgi:rubrerythrin